VARTLNVAHSRQETETGCLAACAQMVLNYLGIQRSQDELARQMRSTPHVGTVGRNILNLQSSELRVVYTQSTLEHLRAWLAQEVPVIALVQTAELPYWDKVEARHAVVVVGLDEDNVYLLDPARDPGVVTVSRGDFVLAWEEWMDGRCAVIHRASLTR
jgi:ABC-type bacteriocin/lantibiotic exporter with double-glycine peptidase domain